MLHLYRSNRVESLLAHLARRIDQAPLSSPFAAEIIVTPSAAMARWVNLALARTHGIAANYVYPLPASFVWRLARELLGDIPETDPLARERTAWRVFAALPRLLGRDAFGPLRRYLHDDGDALERWELAERIADVFDRYQLYRPELIRAWSAGGERHWQAELWRALCASVDEHRVATIDRLLGALRGSPPSGRLPERVNLFAVSSLPPLLFEVIDGLSRHTRVSMYLVSPTPEFWADLVSQRALARKRLEHPGEAELWEVGNSLLASWGRQGQAMQDLLLAEELPIDQDEEGFVEPTDGTLLSRLQRDIFTLTTNGVAAGEAPAPDASLEVHACHGPLRECQVLHDRLLAMFADRPGLRPEDVLVMVPDIAGYAPYIEAVFGYDPQQGRPFVPWNLSDLSVRDEHPLVAVFLELIELPHSRFGHAQILSYLDVPALAKRFGLDSEDIAQIREWLSSAQLRWGLDGAHKTRFGLPALDENTWSQAGLRLFAGYALGAGDALDGIVPIAGVDGGRSELLGRLWHFVSLLRDYAEKLSGRYRIAEWQQQLGGLLDDLFGGADDSEGQLQRIRDALAELGEEAADIDETLSATFVRRWLERRLGAYSERARYLSGGVTFCGLQPMRSVPFEVICLLGMHERAFPRRDRPAEFDLMSEKPRPSDPRRADADRYLFLETLLCARQTLYISYVGRDVRSNAERQPSVLVRELLDYVDQRHGGAAARDSGPLSAQLTTTHSLQPFSPRNYGDDARSFDGYWCEVARLTSAAGGQSGAPLSHWPSRSLPPPTDGPAPVTLLELERFLRHPIRHFVNARLEIYLGEAPVEDDDEPFTLDGLERLRLRQRLVADHLACRPTPTARLRGEGMLPHGPFAELAHEQASLEVATLLERLEPYRGQRPQQRPVDLDLDGGTLGPLRLSGVLDNLYAEESLLRWRAGRLGGGDLLGLWLAHLVRCASGDATSPRSTLLATDGVFTLAEALPPEVARARLAAYVVRYHEGLCRPLPVLRQASFAYARALGLTKADPQRAGRSAWDGNAFAGIPGDKDDPYVALVTRGVPGTPVSHPGFALLAREFYEELLGCGTLA